MVHSTLSGKHGYGEQFDVDGLNFYRRLLSAIQNREFVVYFQPKVSIRDLRIAGAEALVRWNYNGEILPPVKFIPFCERTGLVIDVDFYVLDETCRKMREWLDKGLELVRVSVNFSKYHFNEPGVAEKIYKVIRSHGVPAEYIEVEFTETAYLDKEELLEYTVDKLKSYGIKSSIDDFGSGYSSLNLLQNMDFEVVKLDKSLLGKGVENSKARKVISSIIHMAKELEMEVLAEGVETPEELRLLQDLNCDTVQGFLFDKPLPIDEFEKRLLKGNYPLSIARSDIYERIPMEFQEIEVLGNNYSNNSRVNRDMRMTNKYQNFADDYEEPPKVQPNKSKGRGLAIFAFVLFLFSITALTAAVLISGRFKLFGAKPEPEPEPQEITYTLEEMNLIVKAAEERAVEDVESKVRGSFLTDLREAAMVDGGTGNMLRAYFPDEMVFADGSKYIFQPINKEIKQNTIDRTRLVDDEATGIRYYTDNAGSKISYFGIDVSTFQKDIDWESVKNAGVEFAIIRCAFRGYGSEGRLVEDSFFKQNMEGAIAVGIPVGVYFFTQAVTVDEALEEAEMVIDLIKPYDVTGPVIIDVEYVAADERTIALTESERTDNVIVFCDAIAKAGYDPMIYSNTKYFLRKMEYSRLESYKKWYANYNTLQHAEDEVSLWQYNDPLYFPYAIDIWQYSKSGCIDGINGEVDLNVSFYKWW